MPKKVRVKGKGHEIFFEEPEREEGAPPKPSRSKVPRKPEVSHARPTVQQREVKTAEQPTSEKLEIASPEPASPIKATFYLRPDQVEELERLFTTVRSQHGIRVGKSEIVRVALDMVFAEYREKRDESSLLPKLKREEEEEQKRRRKMKGE